ncbi:MAG: bifunctional metallophosphatase/5'-nucleotidase [Chitinophagaceae bacterium]
MKKIISSLSFIVITLSGFAQHPGQLSFTILQLNDVYEIAPLEGGTRGGMARVATVRKQLLQQDPNTITVLAGDFVSPSLIGTLPYFDSTENKKMKVSGGQMVDVMNRVGVDYVTFGNHEFDISLDLLAKRINESDFTWVNSNVSLAGNAPFVKIKNGLADTIHPYAIHTFHFPGGQSIRLGIIGATLPFNKTQPVIYNDLDSAVNAAYQQLRPRCDIIMALTHLEIGMDKQLAQRVPGLQLIMGGHEHIASSDKVGDVPIYKADANAKSVYIHTVTYDTVSKKVSIRSDLKMIDESVAFDPAVDAVVQGWMQFADSAMIDMGYDPYDSLLFTKTPLDGRESEIRNHVTNYTQLISNALYSCDSSVDMALYNSGSLRVDDQLKGVITQYDVLRSLPFGGGLVIMHLKGDVLEKVLTIGTITNKNSGGYLQMARASFRKPARTKKGQWYIGNKLLDKKRMYKIILPAYVAQGNESNLEFLKQFTYCTPIAFKGFALKNDIRDAVIYFMKHGRK